MGRGYSLVGSSQDCRRTQEDHAKGASAFNPADLKGDGETERLTRLLSGHQVALVDMGHTHYNELANDGTTIYAATRSTGQIDEGPVGYSLATLDNGVVSWRFKALDDPFPFVMITSPADHRLLRGNAQRIAGNVEIHARVFGDKPIARVDCRINDGPWLPMQRRHDLPDWHATTHAPEAKFIDVAVKAFSESGRPGLHAIRAAGHAYETLIRNPTGDDAHAIGPWPENGVFGTQLGPNRNGRKW